MTRVRHLAIRATSANMLRSTIVGGCALALILARGPLGF
jgi:hypothetical protein